jgi:putative copper resistance protein D
MGDSLTVAIRFALYLDLMMLFGLALFGLYGLRGKERASGTVLRFESLLYGTSLLGIALSLVALGLLAKSMSGVSGFMELHHHFSR